MLGCWFLLALPISITFLLATNNYDCDKLHDIWIGWWCLNVIRNCLCLQVIQTKIFISFKSFAIKIFFGEKDQYLHNNKIRIFILFLNHNVRFINYKSHHEMAKVSLIYSLYTMYSNVVIKFISSNRINDNDQQYQPNIVFTYVSTINKNIYILTTPADTFKFVIDALWSKNDTNGNVCKKRVRVVNILLCK